MSIDPVELLLGMVSWDKTRSISGSSESVPEAILELISAESADTAEQAYWKLDNRIVVQGQLFDSACYVIGPLLTGLQIGVTPHVKLPVVNLLVEIAKGVPDETEIRAGNSELAARCQDELRKGLWIFYSLLADQNADIRLGAIELLDCVETDRSRFQAVMEILAKTDLDERVRTRTEK